MNRQNKFWLMLSILLVIAMIVIAIGNARAQTFAIISDYGSADTNENKVSQMVRGWNPQFIITAGDNFHKTLTPLENMIGNYYRWSFPNFFPAAGNPTYTFTAFVTKFGRSAPFEDKLTAQVTLKITGAPTLV